MMAGTSQKAGRKKSQICGFTLLEVVIALLILSIVLTSSLQLIHRYADQRITMQDRIAANQVAWNRLMERYQIAENWIPANGLGVQLTRGVDEESDRNWQWELKIEEAAGQNLSRYKVEVYSQNSGDSEAKLAVFMVDREY